MIYMKVNFFELQATCHDAHIKLWTFPIFRCLQPLIFRFSGISFSPSSTHRGLSMPSPVSPGHLPFLHGSKVDVEEVIPERGSHRLGESCDPRGHGRTLSKVIAIYFIYHISMIFFYLIVIF